MIVKFIVVAIVATLTLTTAVSPSIGLNDKRLIEMP